MIQAIKDGMINSLKDMEEKTNKKMEDMDEDKQKMEEINISLKEGGNSDTASGSGSSMCPQYMWLWGPVGGKK